MSVLCRKSIFQMAHLQLGAEGNNVFLLRSHLHCKNIDCLLRLLSLLSQPVTKFSYRRHDTIHSWHQNNLVCKTVLRTSCFWRLRKITKSDNFLRHFCRSVRPSFCSVCPHGNTRLPLDEFS